MTRVRASVNLLMIDPRGLAFVPKLLLLEKGKKAQDVFSEAIGDAMRVSLANARAAVAPLFDDLKIDPKNFAIAITESEVSKDEVSFEPSDGKSAGLAFALALIAASTGLEVNTDACFTGCIEPDGSVSFVRSFDEKLLGKHGPGYSSGIRFVCVPPPPTAYRDAEDIDADAYPRVVSEFRTRFPEKTILTIHRLQDIFSPGIFDKVVSKESLLRFILDRGYLHESPQPGGREAHVTKCLLSTLGDYIRNFWVEAEESIERGEKLFDFYDNYDYVEDKLLEFFEHRSTSNIVGCLEVLVRNFSAEEIATSPLKPHIQNGFGRHYLSDWPETLSKCRRHFEEDLRKQPPQVTQPQLVSMVNTDFNDFLVAVNSSLSVLEAVYAFDPILAKDLFSGTDLFDAIQEGFEKAKQALRGRATGISHWVDFFLYRSLSERIDTLRREFFDVLDVGEDEHSVRLAPRPAAMDIRIQSDLSSLEFVIDENLARGVIPSEERAGSFPVKNKNVVSNPNLLWEESAPWSLSKYWRADNYDPLSCRIASLPDGHVDVWQGQQLVPKPGLIQRLFSRHNMTITLTRNNPISVLWNLQYQWPPSVDSLWFAKVLCDEGYCDRHLSSVLDVGSGTGFLGIFLAKNNTSVESLYFSDLTTQLKLLTLYNANLNLAEQLRQGLYVRFVTGKGLPPLRGICRQMGKFELIISAPPYLPKVKEYGIAGGLGAAVAGTHLLEELVRDGAEYAREVVVEFSHIALEEFHEVCDLVGVKPRLLATRRVPIRISPIEPRHPEVDMGIDPEDDRRQEEYRRALQRYEQLVRYNQFLERERGMLRLNRDNYKFWHDIHVYSIPFD